MVLVVMLGQTWTEVEAGCNCFATMACHHVEALACKHDLSSDLRAGRVFHEGLSVTRLRGWDVGFRA